MADKDVKRPWSPPQMIWSAVIIAVGLPFLGFNSLGWVTSSTAESMVKEAVIDRLVPICVAQAQMATPSDLEAFKSETSWKQYRVVEDMGWATMPGSLSSERGIANRCTEALLQD